MRRNYYRSPTGKPVVLRTSNIWRDALPRLAKCWNLYNPLRSLRSLRAITQPRASPWSSDRDYKILKKTIPLDPDEILADSTSALDSSFGPEGKLERPLNSFSSFMFLFFVAGGISYLFYHAVFLQLISGDKFFSKSQENRFMVRSIFPPRGLIYDRFERPLLENTPSFILTFEKKEFLKKDVPLPLLLQKLGSIIKKGSPFFLDAGFPENNDLNLLPPTIFIIQDIPLNILLTLASRLDELPGLHILETHRRVYEKPLADSHLIGFVGKVSAEDLRLRPELFGQETVGKSGLEAFYDQIIRGKGGKKIVEVDSSGRETNFRFMEEPKRGFNLILTIDKELQDFAYRTLQNYVGGLKGASIVALDPRNGEVLTLISYPGFDSNNFGYALSKKEFDEILKDPLKPLFNRAIAGEFPSGSTIKPLIAAAALEEKIIEPDKKIYDQGFIEIPNPYQPGERTIFLDWKKHGWVNLYDAIAHSANVYFYMLGGGYLDQKGLGIERIKKYALAFGLGSLMGIDLPGEKPGFIPDPESKKITDPQNPVWRIGDTYNVSIGQGGVMVTPLQMASLTATLANGGNLYQPRLLKKVLDEKGNSLKETQAHLMRSNLISEPSWRAVIRGMRETVTSGTAHLLNDLPQSVAAKTGTAQVGPNRLPHAWVTSFAPADKPKIALAVMVENAGEGSIVAVPITHEILKWYFNNKR